MSMFPDYRIGPEAMKYFELGYKHQIQGEFEKAAHYYKQSLEIEATAEGYTFLGWAYSFMGKLDQAIEECKKAIATDPDFGNPYNDIGVYLLQMAQLDEAIPWLQKAKTASRYATPEFAFCNLGRVFELKALWPLALKEYWGALQLNPTYPPAIEGVTRLEALLN